MDYALFSLLILTGILSLRQQSFYQIYFFVPILILLSLGNSNYFLKEHKIKDKLLMNNLLFLITSILLLSFSIKSTINIFNLNKFVSVPQSRELLCNSQILDYSLKNTPAGTCDFLRKNLIKKINSIFGGKRCRDGLREPTLIHI